MKKSIFTSALLITSLLFAGCNKAQTDNTQRINSIQADNSEVVSASGDTTDNSEVNSVNEDRTDNSSSTSGNKNSNKTKNPVQNVSQIIAGKGQPKVATIKEIVQGDLACYVTLIDEQGKQQIINASFEICPQKEQFINKKVVLQYLVC